MQILVSALEP